MLRKKFLSVLGLFLVSIMFFSSCNGDGQENANKESIKLDTNLNSNENVFNVKNLGAIGDGNEDDTQVIQNIIDSMNDGGTLYFPTGKYLITETIKVNHNNINIIGQGQNSHIIYTYEQKESDIVSSLFKFRGGIKNISVKDLKLEYTGSFFPEVGKSYKGKVSGLYFSQCFDVNIENVEITGFNASGICLMTGNYLKYAKRFKVDKCYLHHNRVAGVLFGNVEQISITNCDLEYNGSVEDGGTGYGCAGYSGEMPKHIQIIGNRARFNYRKGIDLHAGIDALIEGNICDGNRLYGIYAEGSKTGNVVIKGNIISGMKRDTVGIPAPYTWITAIDFGPYSDSLVPEEYHNYIIEGNLIYDFGLKEGDAYPISCYFNFQKGTVQIKNNIIRAGRITHLINFSTRAEDGNRDVKVDISGNQAFIEECTNYTVNMPGCKQTSISQNQITTRQSSLKDGAFKLHCEEDNCIIYTENQIEDPEIKSDSALKIVNKGSKNPKIYESGNFLNGYLEK